MALSAAALTDSSAEELSDVAGDWVEAAHGALHRLASSAALANLLLAVGALPVDALSLLGSLHTWIPAFLLGAASPFVIVAADAVAGVWAALSCAVVGFSGGHGVGAFGFFGSVSREGYQGADREHTERREKRTTEEGR
jgi:hypothetical protein